jgi:lipid-binding SYLF domain-containing protein
MRSCSRTDDDSTRAIYHKNMTFRDILSGKVATPKSADAFLKAVSDAGQQARIGAFRLVT